MHTRVLLILHILLLTLSFSSKSQVILAPDMLGTRSQSCIEIKHPAETTEGLKKGVKAFIPCNMNQEELASFFQIIAKHYKNNNDSSLFLINIDYDSLSWDNGLLSSGLARHTKQSLTEIKEPLFTYAINRGNIIAFSLHNSAYSHKIDQYISIADDSTNTTKAFTNDFLMVKPDTTTTYSFHDKALNRWLKKHKGNDSTAICSLINIWLKTGKRPHFIITKAGNIKQGLRLTHKLNQMPFRSVCFIKDDHPFSPVTLAGNNNFVSGGRVSFPTPPGYQLHITPLTKGHRFSPDIFMFTPQHEMQEIPIRAFPLPLTDKQVAHFHFNNASSPCLPVLNDYFPSSDSMLLMDNERGKTFSFNGNNSYLDCGSALNINFEQPISISAWIKPSKSDLNHSIIGMGRSFSFKIHNNLLTFTRAGISDTRFTRDTIQLNQWQHVAVVFEPHKQLSLFLNGNKIGETTATNIVKSEHSILIGSNIWGEFYQGLIDDLIIWNRALSNKEIQEVSQLEPLKPEHRSRWNIRTIVFLIFPAVVIIIMLHIKRHKHSQSKNKTNNSSRPLTSLDKKDKNCSSILTFGEFRIFTANKENLAPRLSPRERQLLLYLLWHTIRNMQGGVSSRQMSEDLWPGMPAHKAKNNRSTYMQRLRKQLTDNTGIQIIYSQNKRWKLIIPENYYCDLLRYNGTLSGYQQDKDINSLRNYLAIVGEGAFLPQTHNDIIDDFKNEIENEIIHHLTSQVSWGLAQKDQSIIPLLTATIRKHDPLNEPALSLELKWLTRNGHHGRAIDTFQHFCREYENVYGEKLQKEMNDLF